MSVAPERVATAPETKAFNGGRYRIQRLQGGKSRVCHPTFERAEREAQRLLGMHPEATFLILQEVARVKLKPVERADG